MREDSYAITKKQYDYMLPVYGVAAPGRTRLLQRKNRYYFIGTYSDYNEMLVRCLYL